MIEREMRDQLVCVKCWRWYDGRTVCPSCRVALVDPETGHPVSEDAAAGPATGSAPAPLVSQPSPVAGETPDLPAVVGYPSGMPVEVPTRLEVRDFLGGGRTLTSGPLQSRLAPEGNAPPVAPQLPEGPFPPPPPPPPTPAPPPPLATLRVGGSSAVATATSPDVAPARTDLSLAPALATAAAPRPPEWWRGPANPPSGSSTPPPGERSQPVVSVPAPPPQGPQAPPLAGRAPPDGLPWARPAPALAGGAPTQPVEPSVSPPPAGDLASVWSRRTADPIRNRPSGSVQVAEQAGTAGPLGAGLASRIARSRGVETQLAGELLPPPVVATEEVPRAGAPAGKRAHRALLGAAAGLLAGLVVAALWVVAAVVTGLELAPLALVVGIAAGLVMRRLGERRRLSAALAGALVGLLAIALGLVMAAVAAYSHTEGAAAFTSFINAVALLDRSFLPHLWAETGVAGAAAAVAGVILAGLPVLIGRRTAS